ncbi:MAG: Alanine--tRNA ligase [Parcubacteria group bacterium ADurb.Bin316]|nr:MAG: Alanine--tRNA ligase [Parcubacteria group bacterium ADurb.Bin316]HOZ55940.1 alanine--tRNA ligase [bacterium]
MTAKELRQKYLDFFKSKEHTIIPSASLIPENDSTTLFTSSGMQPLVSYLLGEKHPGGKRLVDIQKSFRSEDIEEVGDSRHDTFFEMIGNWSLGDYFKEEQLNWIYSFLIDELKIDPNRLYATVFCGDDSIGIGRDTESVEILKKIFAKYDIEAKDIDSAEKNGMQGGRIFYYDAKKNWWSRSGLPADMPIGEPGGPDSEIFYDLGADLHKHENSVFKDQPCHLNCDCGRFIEIGNNVFMEFRKTADGFEKLQQKNVDFGGGLERIAMALQGTDNVFETDLFLHIINKIEFLTGKKYRENKVAFEIIADHIKAATFIMGDDKGIAPSNTDQGYIVRRLIRRAIRYGNHLGIKDDTWYLAKDESWTKEVAKIIIHDYKDEYPELDRNANFIIENLKEEEAKFRKTLERGLREFEKIKGNINGKTAFDLYQSYGFPIEMTEEIVKSKNMKVDVDGFKTELEKHQELSRTASAGKFKGGLADAGEETVKLHTAAHLLLTALRKVLGDHVTQKGSNITAERLRFDFAQPEKMTAEQIAEVEKLVNEAIEKKLPVKFEEMSLDEARKYGAMGVFESKYGERVKVYIIGEGDDIFSKEICGGPHVENTGILGKFRIVKEESSSAGVRRIKAVLE